MKIAVVLLTLILIAITFAQGPDTLWTRTYGSPNTDIAWCIQETSDHGFIIAGWSDAHGNTDVYLIRTDSVGDTLWTRYFGGANSDGGYNVKETQDGGFVIVGHYYWGLGDEDVYLVKVDANGDSLWTKTYGDENLAGAYAVDLTQDQGFIIAGCYCAIPNADIWILRTDSLGDTLWTRIYDFTTYDEARDVQVLPDGNFIITGIVGTAGLWDAFLMKMTANGDTLWTKIYGGADNDLVNSVVQTHDGGYLLTGYTRSYGVGMEDIWIVKTDSLGDTLWTKTYGEEFQDSGFEAIQTADSNYCIAATTETYSDSIELVLLKVNTAGDTLWTFRSWGMGQAGAMSVQQCFDQGYIIAGLTKPTSAASDDVYVVRLGTEQSIVGHKRNKVVPEYFQNTLFTGSLVLPKDKNCKVFDITGRVVAPEKIKPGIYFVEVEGNITRKVVKVK